MKKIVGIFIIIFLHNGTLLSKGVSGKFVLNNYGISVLMKDGVAVEADFDECKEIKLIDGKGECEKNAPDERKVVRTINIITNNKNDVIATASVKHTLLREMYTWDYNESLRMGIKLGESGDLILFSKFNSINNVEMSETIEQMIDQTTKMPYYRYTYDNTNAGLKYGVNFGYDEGKTTIASISSDFPSEKMPSCQRVFVWDSEEQNCGDLITMSNNNILSLRIMRPNAATPIRTISVGNKSFKIEHNAVNNKNDILSSIYTAESDEKNGNIIVTSTINFRLKR